VTLTLNTIDSIKLTAKKLPLIIHLLLPRTLLLLGKLRVSIITI